MNDKLSHIGDILITFQKSEKRLPTRSISPWKENTKYDQVRVLTTPVDENWRGFPLTTYQNDHWQIWALGEFYGGQPDLPQALIASADLNGHYIIFAHERQKKRWHVLTDRYGTVHAYLANDGKRRALGTFSPAVADAASGKQLDWDALAGFFTFGFFLGDTTYWKDIRIFKPSTHTILDQNGQVLSEHKTWTWYHDPEPNITYEKALVEFAERFESVLRDQVQGKSIALPLSGGLDSRSTLVPLTRNDNGGAKKIFTFSYGYSKNSIETKIASQLAQKRNFDIQTWVIKPYLFDNLGRVLNSVEGFQDITQCRQAYVVDDLASQASHVLAAHWGDVWLDDMGFLEQTPPYSDDSLVRNLFGKYSKKGSQKLLQLFKGVINKDQYATVESLIRDELNKLRTIQDTDFKVKAWKTQLWSFRWTLASLRMYQAGVFTLLPFYDHRLTDFFCKLPSKLVRNRSLQIGYLKRFGPDLAQVAWQPYNSNLFNYQHYNTWLLPKRTYYKLCRILSGKKLIQRNWEIQFLNDRGRLELQNWFLSPGLTIHNFVSKDKLRGCLQDFYERPDAENGYIISMLLTFSAWLEAYG